MISKMKKSWGKPIVQVQLFAPQEYVANCWYVEKSAMYTTLYEDGKDFIINIRPDGYYDTFPIDEKVDLPTAIRVPASGYFRNGESPEIADTSNHWYTSYNRLTDRYSNQVYPLKYRYNRKTYYFSSIKESGHS